MLREILLWYMQNSEGLGGAKEVIRKLDDAVVKGGFDWAHSDLLDRKSP